MIPDFKTYLKESIWSNINKRSEGNLERKEDDVNNFNAWEFYDYLGKVYSKRHKEFDDETGDSIMCSVAKNLRCSLCEINDNTYVSVNEDIKNERKDLFKKLCDEFEVTYMDMSKSIWSEESYFDIEPKDAGYPYTADFKFYMTVLDFLSDNITDKNKLHRI